MKIIITIFCLFFAFCDVLGQCKKFNNNENSEQLMQQFVQYRAELKEKRFENAYLIWKEVYEKAPAADGFRNHVFMDGQKLLEHQFKNTTAKKEKIQIVRLYFQLRKQQSSCYPGTELEKIPIGIERYQKN